VQTEEFFKAFQTAFHERDPTPEKFLPFLGYAIIPPGRAGSRSVPGRRNKPFLLHLPKMAVDHPRVRRPVEKPEFHDLFQEIIPMGRLLLQGEKQARLNEPLGLPPGALAPVIMAIFCFAHGFILYRF